MRALFTTSETRAEIAFQSQDYDEILLFSPGKRGTFRLYSDYIKLATFCPREANLDFLLIAIAVLAADRSFSRESRGQNWNARAISIVIEVQSPNRWQKQKQRLSRLLELLTGDKWDFEFEPAEDLMIDRSLLNLEPTSVSLFSGGADSTAHAILHLQRAELHGSALFLSHAGSSLDSKSQKNILATLQGSHILDSEIWHLPLRIQRKERRFDRTRFYNEPSSRSRALFFIALGLAVASRLNAPLFLPENGFVSLNPPLSPNRLGSLSTRSTNPKFIQDIRRILFDVGAHSQIENPFSKSTKGEMFKMVAQAIGISKASDILSMTRSCGHSDGRFYRIDGLYSCGVCFGCLIRRAAFVASGVPDRTRYLHESTEAGEYVAQKSVVEAARGFAAAGVDKATILALPLSVNFSLQDAANIYERGLQELERLLM